MSLSQSVDVIERFRTRNKGELSTNRLAVSSEAFIRPKGLPMDRKFPTPHTHNDSCNHEDELPEPWEFQTKPTVGFYEAPEVIHVLHHAPCSDGFGAAWAFYKGLIETPPKKPLKVIFTPENHRWEKTKAILARTTIGRETVIALDICPIHDLSVRLHEATRGHYKSYDHHETAQRDCGDLPYCFFDMNRSGAGIAWDMFNKAPRPFLIDCIEAGDLWKWETVPGSSEVRIVMEVSVRFKFDQWDAFNTRLETDRAGVIREGGYYNRYRSVVSQMLTGRKVHKLTIKGQTMPAVNCPIWQSGVGNILVKKIGPCAAVYYWNGTYWAFSLRSSEKGPNVAKLAEQLGGGGHHSAAGFRVDDLSELRRAGVEFDTYSDDEQDRIEHLLSPDQVDQVDDIEMYFPTPERHNSTGNREVVH